MSDLHSLTVAQILEGLQTGAFSSRELTQTYLARIQAHNPRLNAYLYVDAEGALAAAQAADERRSQAGDPARLPPLLGLPIAVKDVLAVAGMPATCGSRILEGFVPSYNASAVQRLLDAGVVILGKTNTDEFAMGSSTENSAYGITRNPWDEQRVPGGSSGGSAAAVAAGLAPVALGTDTGGSVRQPAAFCGLSGLKTSYGRVSRYGLIAYGSSLDTIGVLARSAQDAALVLNVMGGYDPRDATTLEQAAPDIHLNGNATLKGLRIGVPQEYFIEGLQPEVEQAVRAAIAQLETLGAEVRPVSLPHTEYALPVYYIIAPAEASANLARFDGVRYGLRAEQDNLIEMFKHSRGQGFGPEVKRRIMIGTYALSAGYYDAYYGQAQKVRTLIRDDFARAFEQVDLIAAPATPSSAFPIGAHAEDPIQMYLEDVFTLPANLAGVPGLCIPAGFDSQGLPLGLQLLGPHFSEERLLAAAHAYQQVSDHHTRRPVLA
ncbi:MAG: Asp-tRNA(Asn)/Glu-tRNA(Gln) amidotransferase subunit GatA [Anaerolineales bacterium]|nr:Asp-tRNA(Asn)/Glu-tRNA(Gln) amidotransferase subunit GatA [Anaerolineales bacterium]MCW5855458.1 Asp-tRNA(Asn)/Glu-tRNA(Gln) amidotransferase subunit GatA [Anaerolineales bacterium]